MQKILLLLIAYPFVLYASEPAAVTQARHELGDSLPAQHPIHLKWKGEAYGLRGTIEEEISKTRWREQLHLPEIPVDDTIVVEDNQVTEQDTNGQVRKLSGNSRASYQTVQKFLSGLWLADDGAFQELPPDKEGRSRVRWKPKEGSVAEISFGKDHLPAQFCVDQGGGQMFQYDLLNWESKAGVKFPQKFLLHEAGIKKAQTWSLESQESFSDRSFPEMHSREDWHFSEGLSSVTLPLSLYQGRFILVPIKIGNVNSTFVRSPTMEIAGAKIDPQTLVAIDLDHGEFATALPGVDGILGYDFLSRFVVTIDYQAARLTFSPIATFKPSEGDEPISVENDGGGLVVPVKANGTPAKFILDTGNGGEVVIQHVAGQKTLGEPRRKPALLQSLWASLW
jgi:hypothetical protein